MRTGRALYSSVHFFERLDLWEDSLSPGALFPGRQRVHQYAHADKHSRRSVPSDYLSVPSAHED